MIDDYINYCKSRGWRVDQLEAYRAEVEQMKAQARHERELLYKMSLLLTKSRFAPYNFRTVRKATIQEVEDYYFYGDIKAFKSFFIQWLKQ